MALYSSSKITKISTDNEKSDTLMAGDAVLTGTWELTVGYLSIVLHVNADKDSADGGISVQFGVSGSGAADTMVLDNYYKDTNYVRVFAVGGPYFRLVYTNGTTAQDGAPTIKCILDTRRAAGGEEHPHIVSQPDAAYDAFQRMRVSNPHTLINLSHNHGKIGMLVHEKLVAPGTSTHVPNESAVDLDLPTNNASASVIRQSRRYCQYQSGKSLLWMGTGVLNKKSGGNETNTAARMGLFDANNGVFFEYSAQTLKIGKRTYTSGSAVDTTVAVTAFNVDRLDGTGPSRVKIDATKANIFFIDLQWLGVGRVRFGIVVGGRLHICHCLRHANTDDKPYMTRATLPVRYEIVATAGTSALGTMRMICSTVVSEGGLETIGIPRSIGRFYNEHVAVNNVKTCVMALRFKSGHARAQVAVNSVRLMSMATSDFVYAVYHWLHPAADSVMATGTWTDVDTESAMQYNSGTITDWTGAHIHFHGFMSSEVNVVAIDSPDRIIHMHTGIADTESDVLAVMVQRANGTASQDVMGAISWTEHIS
jgi:hypothetical protein